MIIYIIEALQNDSVTNLFKLLGQCQYKLIVNRIVTIRIFRNAHWRWLSPPRWAGWSRAARRWCWTSSPPSSPRGARPRRAGSTGCPTTSRWSATTARASSQLYDAATIAEFVDRSSAASAVVAPSLGSIWVAVEVSECAVSALVTSRTTKHRPLEHRVRMTILREGALHQTYQGLEGVKVSTMLHKCPTQRPQFLSKFQEKHQL